jgi:hypothetical protein
MMISGTNKMGVPPIMSSVRHALSGVMCPMKNAPASVLRP